MPLKSAFQPDILTLATVTIVPIKDVPAAYRKTDVYRRIAASIEHVGIIEPLVVFPSAKGTYLLLDGHTRLDVLRHRGVETVQCLQSTDNESYTYNKRVNYIPPIAQHYMILRALAHVTEDRIAKALNVTVGTIREKRDLLNGICPEAAELLRNERVSAQAFQTLRRMKPVRQIDASNLMIAAHKFSGRFARALLDGTRAELLVSVPTKRVEVPGAQQCIMEQETDEMIRHADSVRDHYGNDVLDLTAACRYVEKLLANQRIRRYLAKNHPEPLDALEQLMSDVQADRSRDKQGTKATRKGLKPGSAAAPANHHVGA